MIKSKKSTVGKMHVRDAQRMYDAGSVNNLTASWDSTSYTTDQVIYAQLNTLRAKGRQQARNNDYVARLIQILQNNIVGANGFTLRSQVIDTKAKPDQIARQVIERNYKSWCASVGLTSLQHVIIASLVTDGEAFVYKQQLKNGLFKPVLIDPALIDVDYNQAENNKPLIRFGIEYNELMEPVAYYVNQSYQKEHPGVGNTGGTGSMTRSRIEAKYIHHIFRPLFVGQFRGIPWVAPSLGRLFQLGRYEDAALTAARIGAAKMGFFRSDNDDEYTGDDTENYQISAEAGTFENIGSLNFQQFDPSYPAGEFNGFVNKTLQGIASGLGVDYHTLGNDLAGVNYSSARVGMLETREYYKTLQSWLAESFITPLFNDWLSRALFAGLLKVGNKELNRGFDYYAPALFQGRRWEWVDPQKEATAKEKLYNLKVTSLSQIIRERGDDPEVVFAEIAEENKQLTALGITPSQVLEKLTPAPEQQPNEQSENEQTED